MLYSLTEKIEQQVETSSLMLSNRILGLGLFDTKLEKHVALASLTTLKVLFDAGKCSYRYVDFYKRLILQQVLENNTVAHQGGKS